MEATKRLQNWSTSIPRRVSRKFGDGELALETCFLLIIRQFRINISGKKWSLNETTIIPTEQRINQFCRIFDGTLQTTRVSSESLRIQWTIITLLTARDYPYASIWICTREITGKTISPWDVLRVRYLSENLDTFLKKIYSDIHIVNKEGKLCALLGDIYLFTSFSGHSPAQRECARTGLRSHARCHPYPIPQPVKVDHTTGVYDPYSFRLVMWVLLRPTRTKQRNCCETGPTVFRPYPRRLESLTICRCHYKGSTLFSVIFKDPECWSSRSLNPRPPARQTGALPTELTRRRFVYICIYQC